MNNMHITNDHDYIAFDRCTSAEMLEWWNETKDTRFGEQTEGVRAVSRWASLASAKKRCTKRAQDMGFTVVTHEELLRLRAADAKPAAPAEDDAPAKPGKTPKAPKTPTGPEFKDRGESIALSWKDPEVAAARARRHNVEVGGTVYTSVRQAFRALGLPDNHHQRFRRDLVAAGVATFDGHKFTVVPGE